MVSPFIGQGIALGSTFIPNFRTWYLRNLDTATQETLQGQFEPTDLTEDISVVWAEHTSLGRENPIMQFVNRANETTTFSAMLFKDSITGAAVFGGGILDSGNPLGKLDKLKSWTRIDQLLGRPPILEFWVGTGFVRTTCVIAALSGITYGRPDYFGGFREVNLSITLQKFVPFSLDDEAATETRYARAKQRDYYELLAFEEYNNPLLGDVIRKAHPEQELLSPGDIVTLPSIEAVRNIQVTQRSIPLVGGFGRKSTPQKTNVERFFDLRAGAYVSHVLQPSTTPAA